MMHATFFLLCGFLICSKASPHLRIVGGKPAPFISFHAKGSANGQGFSSLCSASFISPIHVITAAYCVFDKSNGLLYVPSASWTWMSGTNISSVGVVGKRTFVHPSFVRLVVLLRLFSLINNNNFFSAGGVKEQDVAIMELVSPANTSVVALADDALCALCENTINATFLVAGFGDTTSGQGVYSDQLLFIQQQLVARSVCQARISANR
jgi:hypothetical protein